MIKKNDTVATILIGQRNELQKVALDQSKITMTDDLASKLVFLLTLVNCKNKRHI